MTATANETKRTEAIRPTLADFQIYYLGGRCADGAERDSGTLYHLVGKAGVALCGKRPGRRSAGWFEPYVLPQPITCAACLRRATKAFVAANNPQPEEATQVTHKPETNKAQVMTADFKGSYNFFPEGRQWTVHSTSCNDYVVTIWTDPTHGRMALCSCKASEFNIACKHIRFAQMADSYLTRAPVREILPVYAESEDVRPFLELVGATN